MSFADMLAGDGREMIQPVREAVLLGTQPIPVTRAMARRLVKNYLDSGHSTHSGAGATLWVILAYLQDAEHPYRLTAHPGRGYFVQKELATG